MKKVIALLAVLSGVSMVAHAVTLDGETQQPQDATQNNSTDKSAQQPTNSDADVVGTGSGDDADTANEADPSNDTDPEADEGAAGS